MNEKLISVIVPIYNVEKYIGKCLTSIQNQTYTNIEIICVDDGSPDRSMEICEAVAAKDSRIQIIKKDKNSGQSVTRNIGMKAARGEYISFVDSDDWIAPNHIEILYELIEKNDADIAQGSFLKTAIEMDVRTEPDSPHVICMSGKNALEKMFLADIVQPDVEFTIVCNKLFRRSLIRGIRFPEGKIYEDQFFAAVSFYHCKKVIATDRKTYYYRKNKAGTTWQDYKVKLQDEVEMHEGLIKYFEDKGEHRVSNICSARCMPLAIGHYDKADYFGDKQARVKAYLHVFRNFRNYVQNVAVPTAYKWRVLLFLIWPKLFFHLGLDVKYPKSVYENMVRGS